MQGHEPCAHQPRKAIGLPRIINEPRHAIGRRSATEEAGGIGRRVSMFIEPGLDSKEPGMGMVIERHGVEPVESGDLS